MKTRGYALEIALKKRTCLTVLLKMLHETSKKEITFSNNFTNVMNSFLPTLILRHRRENLKKCSLRGLEGREDMRFFIYPKEALPDLSSYILLSLDAPLLTREDAEAGLFLIDGTWRYSQVMIDQFSTPYPFERRSLPSEFRTAYPRKQDDCPDPQAGLASIEALYIAYWITGRDASHLLDHYYWKESFLALNSAAFSRFAF